MIDKYNRKIEYMRISITDRCDLHCKYCIPDVPKHLPKSEILNCEDIITVVKAAADLGIKYIKITGGEPLVRKDCIDIIKKIKAVPGIEKVTITTNGVILGEFLEKLIDAGIDGINISLDTIDRQKYEEITGFDRLNQVIANIKKACEYSMPVKVNTVVMSDTDWKKMLLLAKDFHICVRFIEMMPIGLGKKNIKHNFDIFSEIKNEYPSMIENESQISVGPAKYYYIPGFKGNIGFIQPIHDKFCDSCNRVRLTSVGFLKSCLCYDSGENLKKIIRENPAELSDVMEKVIYNKPKAHSFDRYELISEKNTMAVIGG